jgi:hypothetical protein
MIIQIDDLVRQLDGGVVSDDTKASYALWIRFGDAQTSRTQEFRTANGNQIVHGYTDKGGALVGIEIFPRKSAIRAGRLTPLGANSGRK